MKRTTIMLPEEIDERLRREARRRGVPLAQIAREAIESYLPAPPDGTLSFTAIGESDADDASERVDELVADAIEREHGQA